MPSWTSRIGVTQSKYCLRSSEQPITRGYCHVCSWILLRSLLKRRFLMGITRQDRLERVGEWDVSKACLHASFEWRNVFYKRVVLTSEPSTPPTLIAFQAQINYASTPTSSIALQSWWGGRLACRDDSLVKHITV
jgi:hypothetical protein